MSNRRIEWAALSAFISAFIITVVAASPALAQRKLEFSIGYSYAHAESTFESETVDIPGESPSTLRYCTDEGRESFGPNFQQFFCEERGLNGFDASATWNVSRYLGIKAAVSGHVEKDTFADVFETGPGETFTARVSSNERLYSLLAGIQLRDSESAARWTPFGHALIGAARQTARLRLPGVFDAESKETALAVRIGGGLDLRLNDRIDLRLIEVNYAPVFAEDRPLTGDGIDVPITIHGRTANNWTVGFGVVVH